MGRCPPVADSGGRMLPGGDLHEREEGFFGLAASRAEGYCGKMGADAALSGHTGGRNPAC
ncbi:MAG: hypothetical protein HFF69_11305 [Oscillospiraceae bacterium]|nr:hypothetical protein [Oscillospiraceae bacterium]